MRMPMAFPANWIGEPSDFVSSAFCLRALEIQGSERLEVCFRWYTDPPLLIQVLILLS